MNGNNVNLPKQRRVVKQYDSLADLMADKKRAEELNKSSKHHSVRRANANAKEMKPEDISSKYSKRRRSGKTARERAKGEANQRYQNRANRAKYQQTPLTNKNDSTSARDEASRLFAEYCSSCNGKKTRAIRSAAR